MRLFVLAIALALATSDAATAQAPPDGWPARPIRMIVPFPAGSASDTAARLLGHSLSASLGQTIVIDDRAGASGNIGVGVAAHAAADGYTLVLGTASTQTLAPSLNPHLDYDPIADFAPVSLVAEAPYVLVVAPAVPATSITQLIALAKAKPGGLNYGSAGPASLAHLAGELFASMASVVLTHVPYKSSAQSAVDIVAGRIELQFATIAPTLPYIRDGRLRAVGVTSASRVTSLPNIPTVAESGLPGYEASLWLGVLAPGRTSPEIIERLNREIVAALALPELQNALVAQGFEPAASTPAAFAARIRSDTEKWRQVIAAADIHEE
ncbi:MAG: tripartite tricarboxylate transporter substrate binding protein [Alphaproteobacteria bacterium]|nr:tripartite tricarboxylate transporter substrate binding protein [Alphaproteobacteria bacterium]